jgi:hypothetical protein
LATYVRVSGADHARLGERADELARVEGNRAYLRMIDGHCLALVVEASTGRLFCSAYDARPQACRDLARGSGACEGERHGKASRPLLALGRRALVVPP